MNLRLPRRSFRRGLIHLDLPIDPYFAAGILSAALVMLSFTGYVRAGTPCDVYEPSCGAGLCDCGHCNSAASASAATAHCGCGECRPKYKQTPIYRALDAVAGGIEHVFGLDKCNGAGCDSSGCDAGCDAAPWMPVPQPMPVVDSAEPQYVRSPEAKSSKVHETRTPTRRVLPSLPSVPDLDPPAATSEEVRVVEPRVVKPSAPTASAPSAARGIPQMTAPRLVPSPSSAQPLPPPGPPLTSPRSVPATPTGDSTQPTQGDGPVFESLEDLNDPFQEDVNRLKQPYGAVRPTGMRSTSKQRTPQMLRSIDARVRGNGSPTHDRSRTGETPSQSYPSAIGSGLRPAENVETLRPVSHHETIELKPLSKRRVLAPYRPSR